MYLLATMIERMSQAWVRDQGLSSLAAFNVLTVLQGAGEPLQPSTIAARLMVTRGTLTGILDSLERGGYIDRRQQGGDGRTRVVTLTDSGRRKVVELRPRVHQAERHLVGGLTPAEQAALVGMLARIQDATSRLVF